MSIHINNAITLWLCIDILCVSTLIFWCVNTNDNRKAHRWMGLWLFVYWNKHYWIVIQYWHILQIPCSCSISWYNFPPSRNSSLVWEWILDVCNPLPPPLTHIQRHTYTHKQNIPSFIYVKNIYILKMACQTYKSRSHLINIVFVLMPVPLINQMCYSPSFVHLILFAYCIGCYCCQSFIYFPTTLVCILSRQLMGINKIIVTSRIM